MSVETTSERTISRVEYEAMHAHGYAGPAAERPDGGRRTWAAPYWSYALTPLGSVVVPTYLDDEPREDHRGPRLRDPYDRAEFQLTDDDAEPVTQGASEDTGDGDEAGEVRGIEAVGVHNNGRTVAYELPAGAWDRACSLSFLAGVPHAIYTDRGRGPARAFQGLGVIRLDVDLDMWFDLDGAESRPVNFAASEIAGAFGVNGLMHGPVVFTGIPDADGVTQDISVAAAVLIAGMAAAHDAPDTGTDTPRGEQRARDFLAFGIEAHHPDTSRVTALGTATPTAPAGSVDVLAHTITVDGDFPRCLECGEYGSHGERQPEALRADPAPAHVGR